ncbi:enoyl-CoA hydratase-related protein [Actinocorallia sp. A-T 12471]|uniref:enoyl-CoA hydratase-related protein n=1 Tax=Actinocorallia sp. A-T 12471 TaxID=3089813 RepID=UPI0029D11AE3|nr:enoyl-CoA hydratase-related protein [Actinocorallia sp. A-T 12471]MDX6742758.1 enoyl-CoA hydratase-related protein [Actinocorallia sp. A-T 12471]
MGEPVVLVEVERGVAVVTLNRPQQLNAMTYEMSTAYAQALRAADADPDVRAIVVTGAGRGFCAGADLAVLEQGAEAIRSFLPPAEDMPRLAFALSKPVVAAINGHAVGIGFAYALGSDVRFAAKGAKLATAFSRLGLVAEYGLSYQLPRLIGLAHATDLLLSGRTIDAAEALSLGLVNRVVEPEELLPAAIAYAADMAENCAPSSLATIKRQVYGDLDRAEPEALALTLDLMNASFGGPDLAEALRARGEKRKPVFTPPPARP